MSTLIIARLTFQEAARRRILLAGLLLGLVFLAVFILGYHYIMLDISRQRFPGSSAQMSEISNFLLMAGLYVVNFLTIMMTVLTSVDTLSGEIASGTIHTLLAKPIRRWEIVLGKWLGFAGMLTLYLVMMAGGVILAIYLRSNYLPPHPVRAVLLLWLNALLLLSISLLGGTMLSTLANGVLVFGLYGVAFIGGWIEQIGTFLQNMAASHTAVNIGIITSLILPSEALWKRAAHEIQSPLVAALGFSPFSSSYYPSAVMIAYSVFYLLAVFFLAIRLFNQRDL
jgi:ABC-type transport system involved in multi-copper enzyme maturation permease subunit